MRISYRETAWIADNLARLLEAGIPLERVFEKVRKYCRSRRAREAVAALRDAVLDGRAFHEGLAERSKAWPPYFIELVRCSEIAGMLNAGFAEGASHFRKLGRARLSAHKLWLVPVIITVFGWVCIICMWTWFLGVGAGLDVFAGYVRFAAPVVFIVLAVLYVPPLRSALDVILLALPLVAETVRDLSLYQFTSCFRYLYIGAVHAPDMMRYAAGAVGNSVLRRKLRAAAEPVERGSKFAEALGPVTHWPGAYISELEAGEISGQLETVLNKLADERKDALETRVAAIRQVTDRLFGYATAMSIAMNALAIAHALQARGTK